MELDKLLRPHLKGLKPYSSARSEYMGDGILLDANENAIGSPAGLALNRYPDPLQRALKKEILEWLDHDLKTEQLFLGNGSDEVIDLLIRAFCEPGKDEILICPPVFGMFEKAAQINNVWVRKVQLLKDFQLDINHIKSAVSERTKIIFLCSPNNPTGNLLNSEDIRILLASFQGLMVIDEAYMDFSPTASWLPRITQYQNLLVMKTFSKAWGLAAARCGMLAAHPAVIDVLNTIKMPYNINTTTMGQVSVALRRSADMNTMVEELNRERSLLQRELEWMDMVRKIYPSDANFLLVKFDDPASVYAYLSEKGIIVRDRSNLPLCEGCLRITVGSPRENRMLIDSLQEYNRLHGGATSNVQ